MFLDKGQRGLLMGKTGSGKTQGALFQLMHTPLFPVIIGDTKIEDAFFSLADEVNDITLEVANTFAEFEKLSKLPRKEMPDYILVRPESFEVVDTEQLDKYLQLMYRKFGNCFIYLDEVFNWHMGGKPLPGLMELLARGRSKGKTLLMGNQRPSWISRSCFTESDKFYIHKLLDLRDRKTLDAVIPDFSDNPSPAKYHFYHFDVSGDEEIKLFSPVPETKVDKKKIFRRKWV